ncbi:uncharacterized protein [Watersipora subatra]|uniref:uncharacterized protein isoform X2 n=1 Tax=Watersipora subatra TaxID=2589382 RepID=UPI00355BD3E5
MPNGLALVLNQSAFTRIKAAAKTLLITTASMDVSKESIESLQKELSEKRKLFRKEMNRQRMKQKRDDVPTTSKKRKIADDKEEQSNQESFVGAGETSAPVDIEKPARDDIEIIDEDNKVESSESSDESTEDEGEELSKGAFIENKLHFLASELTICQIDANNFTISYKNDTRVFIKSGEYTGRLQTFPSKYSHSILIKKGEVLEHIRNCIEKLLGKNKKLKFFGKTESTCMSVFPITVENSDKAKCLNVSDNGVPKLIPLADLDQKTGIFEVVLQSGKIVKKSKHEYEWKVYIVEARLKDLPAGSEGYFRVCNVPKIRFF